MDVGPKLNLIYLLRDGYGAYHFDIIKVAKG